MSDQIMSGGVEKTPPSGSTRPSAVHVRGIAPSFHLEENYGEHTSINASSKRLRLFGGSPARRPRSSCVIRGGSVGIPSVTKT